MLEKLRPDLIQNEVRALIIDGDVAKAVKLHGAAGVLAGGGSKTSAVHVTTCLIC